MIPEDLLYTKDHEWARKEGEIITVGITDHAQRELTDVVFVELPGVDEDFVQGDTVVVVESVKAASDTYAPASGVVVEVNSALEDEPGLLNTDPYGKGWIYKLNLAAPAELESLMKPADYAEHTGA